jgi:hypothetical protein
MLKLIDAQKAAVFGLPAKDLEESEALKLLAHLDLGAKAHLEDAVISGAFQRERPRLEDAPKKGHGGLNG